ncbi:MAG: hypothetical protein JO250_05675 [Armatimonadetes bacterium]|nr:hypothetical protein [Armatimonadota bacterium]
MTADLRIPYSRLPALQLPAIITRLLNAEGVPVPVGTPQERAQVKALIAQSFQSARERPG